MLVELLKTQARSILAQFSFA